ncbi:glucose-6-phosphate dehydrogenase [Kaistella jeonii]|uniref:Glucose-6-phosphate 1-dehydrogenase n=1 Tax=Kaistella jeonii TaxID=266749 RepID=A0A0C1CX53_9FLAO|nr:glucose-6-phosphate dehydrogenase [Kaistella jeonii]KIA86025.1 glucose-6-phosphate dehydrogenase [Kaistella jeonii]SFC36572.1 glucose-6-phosphate 1-dehydrogenase [Kaistella jeonii]VEI97294.1 Glucose-6-phosphate 1-dehydrogenase [Kaistella jeonii]
MTKTSVIETTPTVLIIFGGNGDLTKRKIIPALYNLFLENRLPEKFAIIGTSRTKFTDEKYRSSLLVGINEFSRTGKAKKEDWAKFSANITYQAANIKDVASYNDFEASISKLKAEWKQDPAILYYCAVSPDLFCTIAENVSKSKLENNKDTTRIIIEKPFGRDLDSAKTLNAKLLTIFDEKQIYRIDHYLGKEVVQNVMAFRFANTIMEPLWNRTHIEHVQISVTEQIGVEDRGSYFDHAGILRDMIQNHLLQLLCIIAMEPPVNFDADLVRDKKVEVLKAMRKIIPGMIDKVAVRGQYGPGWVEGKEVPGYRDEIDVDPGSNTETYAAMKFYVDNWRWQGVPFYLRTGKRLYKSASHIIIQFREVPHNMFTNKAENLPKQNRLIISIQPDMSIKFQLESKTPGLEMTLNTVDMVFDYLGKTKIDSPEAYETLLLDVISGDQTLFMRADQVEAAWEVVMPVLDYWENNKMPDFPNYPANSWGPENAEALIAKDGFHWINLPDKNLKE